MLGKWKKKVPCATPAAVGCGHTRAFELGYRRTQDALPGLQPARFARGGLDLWRHGPLFVTHHLTEVNDQSH